MDNQKLKILSLEDNQDDVLRISNILKEQKFEFEPTLVNTKEKYIQKPTESLPDIVLRDYALKVFNSTKVKI